MGGAYAKGFVQALVEYAYEHPEICNGLRIAEYDLAPYQPDQQTAVYGVDTYQRSHKDDNVAGDKRIKGASYESKYSQITNFSDKSLIYGHPNGSFAKDILSLPKGKYVFRNGHFVKVQ